MRKITLAATQMECIWDEEKNLETAESLVEKAANQGANIVLLQELFAAPYFCKDQDPKYFELAKPYADNPLLNRMSELARKHNVVLPISFFERDQNRFFNSLCVIDADGTQLGKYQKSHIPDGPGYQEKFYFTPGQTGFKVWDTKFCRIGVGICWDQWFPEAARAMVLQGAEVLFYPTAIGSEPPNPDWNSQDHWQRVMQGHAGANLVPLVASNRIGKEVGECCELDFYGGSFIAGATGELLSKAQDETQSVITAEIDLDVIQTLRHGWGIFRDRRTDLYGKLVER